MDKENVGIVTKKRGRPKGSKSKKTTKTKIVQDTKAKIVRDQYGSEHFVVLETKVYYTFTNLRKGPMHFKREDGKEDFFAGRETKKDITEAEREIFLNTDDFRNGWIVEEQEDTREITEESVFNKNSLSDSRLKQFVEENKNNKKAIERFIEGTSHEFALKRLRDAIVDADLPSSLIVFCDYRLKQLEEEYAETKKAPIEKEV